MAINGVWVDGESQTPQEYSPTTVLWDWNDGESGAIVANAVGAPVTTLSNYYYNEYLMGGNQ
jgi:hypothetical protein